MFYKSNMSMGYMESPKNTPKRSRSLSNLANAWQASNKVSRLQTQLETLKYKLFKKDETIQDLEVALNMERKDSKKVKKKEIPRVLNKDSKGLNRRNSTSVSSIKRKESGPKSKLFEETEGSFDTDPIESPMEEGMNQSVPGPPRSPKKILFADEIKKDNNPEIELEEPTIAESVASDVTEVLDDDDDVLAEVNANINKILKKEKKQIKEAEEKAKEEESKANPNLLKPTDIPAKVMEDKKNLINNKKKNGENGGTDGKNSESSTTNNSKKDKNTEESSSADETKKDDSTKDGNVAKNDSNTTTTKDADTPKSPSKNNNNTKPEPPKSPAKNKPSNESIDTANLLKEAKAKADTASTFGTSILKSPLKSNNKNKNKNNKDKGKSTNIMSSIKKGKQSMMIIPKNLVHTLPQKEKDKMLKKEVVEAFATAAARNERARKNKWLRWKYIDDLKKEDDWLSDQKDDMGWAVGRRIYDKEEIERADERMNTGRAKSSMNNKQQNVTLREAKKMFGLWDNVYHQNAVKNLDPTARWDPTKMAQERKKKVEKENEESSEEETDDEDEDGNPKLDEDGNRIKKKKKKKGKDKDEDKTAFGTLTDEDMKQLLLKTSYNTEEIMQWHFDFLDECPTGKLSKAHLQRLFKKVFPNGDTENFVAFIFRLFDIDHSNILEFNEFLQAIDLVTRKSEDERLIFTFRLYDEDGSGKIDLREMAKVIETLDGLEGKRDLAQIHPDDPDQKSPAYRFAERMFKLMDDDGDGEITIEEFVKGFHKMKLRENSSGRTTVTAMVTERRLTKEDMAPKPAIPHRRKSLKDGSKLKNLFNEAKEGGGGDGGGDATGGDGEAGAKPATALAAADGVAAGEKQSPLTKATSAAVAATAAKGVAAKMLKK